MRLDGDGVAAYRQAIGVVPNKDRSAPRSNVYDGPVPSREYRPQGFSPRELPVIPWDCPQATGPLFASGDDAGRVEALTLPLSQLEPYGLDPQAMGNLESGGVETIGAALDYELSRRGERRLTGPKQTQGLVETLRRAGFHVPYEPPRISTRRQQWELKRAALNARRRKLYREGKDNAS